MSRFKLGITAALLVLALCLFAGCSADALMNTGKTLGQLGSAGLGTGGDVTVAKAAETINGFIEAYEECLLWDGTCVRTIDEKGAEKINGDLRRIANSDKIMFELLGNVLYDVQKAKDSKAADAELRKALDTLYKDYDGQKRSYKGYTADWFGHVNAKEIVNVLDSIPSMLLNYLPAGMDLALYNLPFPVQGSEFLTLLSYAQDHLLSFISYANAIAAKIQRSGGGGESKFKIKDLKYIPESIEKYVNGRKDVTVGDKIAFCFIYDLVQTALKVLDRYVEQHPEEDDNTMFDSLNAEWILGNCGAEIDRVMAELEVVAYIYDFNLDVAGLVGKILGN